MDRVEYAAGPRSQSAASAFLPSRGADPVETSCGGRCAEIRGQGVSSSSLPATAPEPQHHFGAQRWGREEPF